METINADIEYVEKTVCDFLSVEPQKITNRNKSDAVALARSFIMYILHYSYGLPTSVISKKYARTRRDVFWNIEKISNLRNQKKYKKMYDNIMDKIVLR